MKIKKILSIMTAVAVLATLLTACSKSTTKTEGKDKIVISEVTHSIFYAPMYAAINNGYFEENNIEIELINSGGADKVMTAVLTGAADIGFAGPEATVYVYAQGKADYPKVFAQLTKCDGSFLIGREAQENFDWKSLKGAEILPGRKGGIPYMTLLYALNQNGLEVGKDVTFNDSIQFDAMVGAFVSGQGDYVTAFEPSASALEQEGKGFIVASVGAEGGEVPYTTFFANESFLNDNQDLVQRFTNAIYKGQQFVQNSTIDEIAKAVAPSFADTNIEVIKTVVKNYRDIGAYSLTPVMSEESFNRLISIIKNAGELEQSANIPFDAIIDNTFANKEIK